MQISWKQSSYACAIYPRSCYFSLRAGNFNDVEEREWGERLSLSVKLQTAYKQWFYYCMNDICNLYSQTAMAKNR
jgi:hypothetical protein